VSVDNAAAQVNNPRMGVHRQEGGFNGEPWAARTRESRFPSPWRPARDYPLAALPLPSDRVAELEARLRRIAAELRAAGIMDDVVSAKPARDLPHFAELTRRQREILIRLLNAERVSLIAAELYLSPSTVRNHLATIFGKFGVHSQAELLGVLRNKN
jgi:DNA-binding CsgD family transcriptional regulator